MFDCVPQRRSQWTKLLTVRLHVLEKVSSALFWLPALQPVKAISHQSHAGNTMPHQCLYDGMCVSEYVCVPLSWCNSSSHKPPFVCIWPEKSTCCRVRYDSNMPEELLAIYLKDKRVNQVTFSRAISTSSLRLDEQNGPGLYRGAHC